MDFRPDGGVIDGGFGREVCVFRVQGLSVICYVVNAYWARVATCSQYVLVLLNLDVMESTL